MSKDLLIKAFERLRLNHLTFRRAGPDEMREIEAMRFEVHKMLAAAESLFVPMAVVATQLRLMERAFYVLRLGQYANAPENCGWMNLFREWGRDSHFNTSYGTLKQTLSPDFRTFYDTYICDYKESIDQHPIRHPWHSKQEGDRGVGLFMDIGRTEPPVVPAATRPGADGVDNTKGRTGADPKSADAGTATSSEGSAPVPNA
jgi:hypothetical protein